MLRQHWRELTTAGVFALLAVGFLVEGSELAFSARGVPGPGLFPILVAVVTLVFSVALAGSTLVGRSRASTEATVPGGEPTATADEPAAPIRWRRPTFLAAALLGCALLMSVVGFVVAMVLLVGLLLIGMERRRDPVSLVSVVAVPVAFYVLFAVLLDVRLPTGLFG